MDSNYLELKLFLNLTNKEIAEVLEKLEALQDIETFRELKKEILIKYESKKAIDEKIIYESINCPSYLID
jgi:predicted nucleic acid-binding OB-fold protein